jgi:hypothetical protein
MTPLPVEPAHRLADRVLDQGWLGLSDVSVLRGGMGRWRVLGLPAN